MKKKYYIIGEELFYGTSKKAFARSKELYSSGQPNQVRKITNKRELKDLIEAQA